MKTILIIDGNYLAHRSFWAVRGLTTRTGFETNLIYGFLKSLFSLIAKLEPYKVYIGWDLGGKTWRHELADKYVRKGIIGSGYKAQRKHKPGMKSLHKQIEVLRKFIAECFVIGQYGKEGIEGDDIIATVAEKLRRKRGWSNIVIATSDADFYQLIDKGQRIFIYNLREERLYKSLVIPAEDIECNIPKKQQVWPTTHGKQIIEIGAIMGDGSDNIIGVKGIGPRRAAQLINVWGGLKNILSGKSKRQLVKEHLEEQREEHGNKLYNKWKRKFFDGKPNWFEVVSDKLEKYAKMVCKNRTKVLLAYKLKKMRRDVEMDCLSRGGKLGFRSAKRFKKYCRKLEFKSFSVLELQNTFGEL